MDQETVGNIVLLAIVTLISVVQNGFFAHKVEHESKTQNGRSFQRTGTLAFERVYTANSRRLCWPDVPVREAKILRRLPGGENSEFSRVTDFPGTSRKNVAKIGRTNTQRTEPVNRVPVALLMEAARQKAPEQQL
ncbi:arachidonate 5-lipoxygenase-activating protein isoform X3 [Felis catus]|uniref:arachidonate 5-lipoxygenase-activating protein isoform X3 n=1 Tax=Felis catus TaxID=9685 RepID=UPI0005AC8FCD|nr:arachidonate 5-lipoxygenase-activating protein isoform X3 [Felis catus]